MDIKNVNLETVCGSKSQLPQHDKLEVAFVGRSNVGKSSLINALINRKSYARTSQQPGKTQTINFYLVNHALYFVDLPGYGYAKASAQAVRQWKVMVDSYLKNSRSLRLVFLLADIRHLPNDNDRQMVCRCTDYGLNPVIIATKSDKLKRSQTALQLKAIKESLGVIENTPIVAFSARDKTGREEILDMIDEVYADFCAEKL